MGAWGQVYKTQGTRVLRNNCTSTEAATSARRAAPDDVDPAVAGVPVHARDAAVRVTRAATEGDILDIEVFPCINKVREFEKKTFEQCDAVDLFIDQRLCRHVFEL